jgi:hypothetical protein
VTRFQVQRAFLDRYPVQLAGGRDHQEHWIPADELECLNQAIVGEIEVVREFRADG